MLSNSNTFDDPSDTESDSDSNMQIILIWTWPIFDNVVQKICLVSQFPWKKLSVAILSRSTTD